MAEWKGFSRGMGIGGWLTNYKRFNVLPQEWRMKLTVGDYEHFAGYITRRDVQYIASLGCDHIRLGFDQIVMEEAPFRYREETFGHIDRFLDWCEEAGLNVVLNLHKSLGNYCDIPEDVTLLESEELQARFIALWEYFEDRYAGRTGVAFELLNELRDVDAELWNSLAGRTVAALRKKNPARCIVVGSTHWNNCATLKNLRVFDDPNVVYTFHTYAPHEFTHQQGVLQATALYYNRRMTYPGPIGPYREFRELFGEDPDAIYGGLDHMGYGYLYRSLEPAVEWSRQHPDKVLWCGEFGTIRHAPLASRENWMRDVISICKQNGIPYSVWNYLSTPNDGNRFSLVDDDRREILSAELARIIRGEV